MAAEQEIAHVVAEGAADVAAAVGQGTRQTAAVERTEGVGAAETWKDEFLHKLHSCSTKHNNDYKEPLPVQMSPLRAVLRAQEVSASTYEKKNAMSAD